jgi:hypothetical protein
MMNEEKIRLRHIAAKAALACGIGLAYACFVSITGWGIPCMVHSLTGLDCPGCGISRMFLALLRLDFAAAARYNLLVLCLLPVGVVLLVYKARQYVKTGHTDMGTIEKVGYIVVFLLTIVFTVLRNTDIVPFLVMP